MKPLRTVSAGSAPGDFEDICLETPFSDSSSTKSVSSRDSAFGLKDLDEDYDTDATSTTNSVLIDPHKLNGYAINSLKSKSTQSLPQNDNSRLSFQSIQHQLQNHQQQQQQQQQNHRPNSQPVLTRQRSMGNIKHSSTTDLGSNTNVPSRQQVQAAPVLRRVISTSTPRLDKMSRFEDEASSGLHNNHRMPKSRTGSLVRLTRKQIEAQFDADSDVIDDSCIWNVPLSPALYAQRKQMALQKKKPASITTTSCSSSPSSVSTINTAPSSTASSPASSISSPLHHSSIHSNEMPIIKETEVSSINSDYIPSNDGLEGLDSEVQDLTRQFEGLPGAKHFDMNASSTTISTTRNSSSSSSLKYHYNQQHQTPTRRPTDPLDPMSSPNNSGQQTRPSWLPPKSPEEERKHMQEFHKLIEQTAQADKKREEKRKSQQQARQKQERKDEMDWESRVLPNFDREIKDAKTREMWWRGVPTKFREQVWKQKIGNRLEITNQVYVDCLNRATSKYDAQIEHDASDTFKHLHIFAKGGPYHDDLVNVLRAYAVFRPQVGYQHKSMANIAAMFLLNMGTPLDSFVAFANCLEGSMSVAMYTKDERTMSGYYTSFLKVLNTKLPKLYQHFQDIRLSPSVYLRPMMIGWFTQHLSIDLATRIWDVLIFEGDGFLLRVALGVLNVLEFKLYGGYDEVMKELGCYDNESTSLNVGEEDAFMESVRMALKQ